MKDLCQVIVQKELKELKELKEHLAVEMQEGTAAA
jgi:hypothetical protein